MSIRRSTRYIVLHHSDSPTTTTVDQIREWHRARGFSDIGYHWIVRVEGGQVVVQPGRPSELVGAHCRPRNHDSLGICVCGDYSREAAGPLWDAAVGLAADLARQHGIPVERVIGHREGHPGHTECPGLLVDLDAIRATIGARMGGGV